MKKRWFVLGMIFLLILPMLWGCGIAQEQYDAVVAELDKARQESQSAKTELQTAQAKLAELTSSLEKAATELKATQDKLETEQAKSSELTASLEKTEAELESKEDELETTASEYESFRSDVKSTWDILDRYLALNHEVLGINAGLALDDLDLIYQSCSDVTVQLATLGNEPLKSYWEQAFIDDAGEWNLYYAPYERFLSKLAETIKNMAADIREELSS